MRKKVLFYLSVGLSIIMAVGGMALAYIISVLFTPLLVINLLVAMPVFGVICFGLIRCCADVFGLEQPGRFALTLSLASVSVIVLLGALPTLHTRLFPAADTVGVIFVAESTPAVGLQ